MEGDDPFGHSGDEFGAGSSDTGSSSSGAPEEVGWPSSGLPFTYSESDGHARPWEQVGVDNDVNDDDDDEDDSWWENPAARPSPNAAAAAAYAGDIGPPVVGSAGAVSHGAVLPPPLSAVAPAAAPPAPAAAAAAPAQSRRGARREPPDVERPGRPKRARAAASEAAALAASSVVDVAQAGVDELAAQCGAEWRRAGPRATVGEYRALRPEVIFELINDSGNPCQGRRPDLITDADLGKVFVERMKGVPGKARKDRRQRGLQKWSQGDTLWFKRVEPYRYGPQGKGEVWAKAVYGQVKALETTTDPSTADDSTQQSTSQSSKGKGKGKGKTATAGAAAAAADVKPEDKKTIMPRPKFSYNMYELHWFNSGRPEPPPGTGGRGKKTNSSDKADWMQGALYHVKSSDNGAGGGGGGGGVGASRNAVRGTLTMELANAQERQWIQFDDAQGNDKGSIALSEQGRLELVSTAGDFAEYHPKDPSEITPFEEGDIVGLGPAGLTRRTKGMKQLGVITRRAIIKGSRPPAESEIDFDTVAHVGIVPVKVRQRGSSASTALLLLHSCHGGSGGGDGDDDRASNGSYVVPSGWEDGTGFIVTHKILPRQCVGRTVATVDSLKMEAWNALGSSGSSSSSAYVQHSSCCSCMQRFWHACHGSYCCRWTGIFERQTKWQLVDITVIDPARTVTEGSSRVRKVYMVATLCLTMLLLFVLFKFVPCTYFNCRCEPLVLAHGRLRGECEGETGTTCSYVSCESGYVMVPAASAAGMHEHDYDAVPSDELSRMVASYPSCDDVVISSSSNHHGGDRDHGDDDHDATTLLPLERQGWTCYRHGEPPPTPTNRTRSSGIGRSRSAPPPQQQQQDQPYFDYDNGDLGWCIDKKNLTSYCAIRPPVCTACTYPALGSGWRGCEFYQRELVASSSPSGSSGSSSSIEGASIPERVCMDPDSLIDIWLSDNSMETYSNTRLRPILANCWLPEGRSVLVRDSSNGVSVRYDAAEICTLPLPTLSHDVAATAAATAAGDNAQSQSRPSAQSSHQTAESSVSGSSVRQFQRTRTSTSTGTAIDKSKSKSKSAAGGASEMGMGMGMDMECRGRSLLDGAASYQSHGHPGVSMRCVERQCPAETVSLVSIGACHKCDGKDAILHFPRTGAINGGGGPPRPSSATAGSTSAAGGAHRTNQTTDTAANNRANKVTLRCPAGFSGSVSRTCEMDGQWSATTGACTRLHCPTLRLEVSGDLRYAPGDLRALCRDIPITTDPEHMSAELRKQVDAYMKDHEEHRPGSMPADWTEITNYCFHALRHSISFDETPEGTGRVVAQCPWPNYDGYMTAVCHENSNSWVDIQGQCTQQFCPATWRDVKFCAKATAPPSPSPAPGAGAGAGAGAGSALAPATVPARRSFEMCDDDNGDGDGDGHDSMGGMGAEGAEEEGEGEESFTVRVRVPQQTRTLSHGDPNGLGSNAAAGTSWNRDIFTEASSMLPKDDIFNERWVMVPCCSEWTTLGGCIDQQGALGWLLTQCEMPLPPPPLDPLAADADADGQEAAGDGDDGQAHHRIYHFSEKDRIRASPKTGDGIVGCQLRPSVLGGARLDHAKDKAEGGEHEHEDEDEDGRAAAGARDVDDGAAVLYRSLVANLGDAVGQSTNGMWTLPPNGVLSSVSVSMQQHIGQPTTFTMPSGEVSNPWQWRPITLSRNYGSDDESGPRLDATMAAAITAAAGPPDPDPSTFGNGNALQMYAAQRAKGRSAAAFADAICKQQNYSRAVLVTSCRALYNAVIRDKGDLSKIHPQDLSWWSARAPHARPRPPGAAAATAGGDGSSSGSGNLTLDEVQSTQLALFSQLCPELMQPPPPPPPDSDHSNGGNKDDDATPPPPPPYRPFGELRTERDVSRVKCSRWLDVHTESDTSGPYLDPYIDWMQAMMWNREHPANYTMQTDRRAVPEDEFTFSLVQPPVLKPFPDDSSCSGHPKEAEDISRCFFSQLQRRLDFPHAVDSSTGSGTGSGTYRGDYRACQEKIIVGCSDEPSRPQPQPPPQTAADQTADQTKPKPGKDSDRDHEGAAASEEGEGTWVIGDQTSGVGVSGNWRMPKIFLDYGGPLNCVTGADSSDTILHGNSRSQCWGSLLEYWR